MGMTLEDVHLKSQTMHQLLDFQSQVNPDTELVFLSNGEDQKEICSLGDLHRRAQAIAYRLSRVCKPGDRALLMFMAGLDFVEAFFGCLYAGVIAVPVYPPWQKYLINRVESIIADANIVVALSTQSIIEKSKDLFEPGYVLHNLLPIAVDSVETSEMSLWSQPSITGDTTAFLQYTSGSTGAPKGVMVSHKNLIDNSRLMYQGLGHHSESVGFSWLPPFHDMGLIGCLLQPIYGGFPLYFMSPLRFMQKPLRWLENINRYKVTTCGAPNFAYDLCVDKFKPERYENLDLSTWELAFTGAEPIRSATLQKFAKCFEPYGFDSHAFYPCYGLAEATLIVSGADFKKGAKTVEFDNAGLGNNFLEPSKLGGSKVNLVSSGKNLSESQEAVIIVNPETKRECLPSEVGEIWVCNDSVAQGYWKNEEATKETFQAYMADSGKGPYLRTGDLGAVHEGELYVTGRLKDMLIIHGRNHYPQDIEHSAELAHQSLKRGGNVAAFPVQVGDHEELVILQETGKGFSKYDPYQVIEAIRLAVLEKHELEPYQIILIKPGTILKTSSGKIQRKACKQKYFAKELEIIAQWDREHPSVEKNEKQDSCQNPDITTNEVRHWLVNQISKIKKMDASKIDPDQPFSTYGLTSLDAVGLTGDLSELLGLEISPTTPYDHPTINLLIESLYQEKDHSCPGYETSSNEHEDIAVVGISCRFPGGIHSPEDLWNALIKKQNCISQIPENRWDVDSFYDPEPGTPNKMISKKGGFLTDIDRFDADFFRINNREATYMDPQHRYLMEMCHHALEDAGISPESVRGSNTGVFIGISNNDYIRLIQQSLNNIDVYSGIGNAMSMAANRLSYSFDFKGPSFSLDSACSSSLLSIHHAVKSLRSHESSMAIAGGINMILNPDLNIVFSQAQMISPDGNCKAFDKKANGYVRSEGAGLVVLKRLSDAEKDKHPILAVIRGSAVKQDGLSNGITAPNGPSQEDVIRTALADASVKPEEISFIETHGTGTSLGDPIEVNTIGEIFKERRDKSNPLYLGAVKSNLGHLESAAGVAGFIKSVLALDKRRLPPNLHFETPNPHISWDRYPLHVPTEQVSFKGSHKIKAGVSAFGFGGTNVHLVLENYKEKSAYPSLRKWQILPMSNRTKDGLYEQVDLITTLCESKDNSYLADAAYTLAEGRGEFSHRAITLASSNKAQDRVFYGGESLHNPDIYFMFTGQGAQYPGMFRDLMDEKVFHDFIHRCQNVVSQYSDINLLDYISGVTPKESNTQIDQILLFCTEIALVELYQSYGIRPKALIGHSVGEFSAAYLAGLFTLEQAVQVVLKRGQLMNESPEGHMVAVGIGVEEIQKWLPGDLYIAADNGPKATVISGEYPAIQNLIAILENKKLVHKELTTSHPFHSPLMGEQGKKFSHFMASQKLGMLKTPLISNVTGGWLNQDELEDDQYWCRHITGTVEFRKGCHTLLENENCIIIEIGPKAPLTGILRQYSLSETQRLVSSQDHLYRKESSYKSFLWSLGQCWAYGAKIDWTTFYSEEKRCFISLPGYRFNKQRYWISDSSDFAVNEGDHSDEYLQNKWAKSDELQQETVAEGEDVYDYLCRLLSETLKQDFTSLDYDTPLQSLGIDSLLVVGMRHRIKSKYSVEIPIRNLMEETSINNIAEYIIKNIEEKQDQKETGKSVLSVGEI